MLPINAAVDCTLENKPKPTGGRRKRVIESEDEAEDDEGCESESEDDEETEEDRAFINDGRLEKAELDTAGIDAKNIIPDDGSGGRPKRQRKAPVRWEHPDADTVMRKFCDKWKVTEQDIDEIFNEPDPEDVEDEDDSSFHSDDEEEDDDVENVEEEDSKTEDNDDEEEEDDLTDEDE